MNKALLYSRINQLRTRSRIRKARLRNGNVRVHLRKSCEVAIVESVMHFGSL